MISKSNKSKKGFTIVELVIVIAVVAILSAVLIPTFVGLVKKAKVSADVMTVRNINNSLKMSESSTGKKPATYTEMLEIAGEAGYDVNKLNPTTEGYAIVWDKDSNTLYLYNDEGKLASNQQGTPSSNLWYMVKTASEAEAASAAGKNVYLSNKIDESTITVKGGIEVAGKTNVHLSTNEAGTFDVCLNGGKLEVTADRADVNSYGTKSEVVINAVKVGTFKENGNVSGNVVLKKGGLEVKSYAKVYSVLITADNLDNVKVSIPSSSSIETVVAASNSNVANALKNNTSINVPQTSVTDEVIENVVFDFASGFGTKDIPYIIETEEQMQNITKLYDEKKFAYYKVADGVTEFDGTNWTRVNLFGCFDGNGVTFNNLTNILFGCVGYDDDFDAADDIIVKNLTINANVVSQKNAAAVASYTDAKKVTFENITVHGYIEGTMNTGSFVSYGSDGTSCGVMELTFKDCYCDADVYVLGNPVGAYVGHHYMNNSSTIKIENCEMKADLYSTSSCCSISGNWIADTINVYVDGTPVANKNAKYDANRSHSVVLNKLTAPAQYETFSVAMDARCERATFMLIIGPNGNGTTVKGGYYCGTYMTEEATVVEGNLVSSEIKNFDITSNGTATTETGLSDDGKTYNVVSEAYNNEIGGASVRLVQYDKNGEVICVTEWTLYKNNVRV